MGQIVPLGAVVYGSLIFAIERLGRMFWALAQRRKDIERGRQEGREEGRQEGFQEGWEKLIQLLEERNFTLPPEILGEFKDRPKDPPKS